jgi:hypothetical protein|tara:strand:- start:134 stop:400 length:267 start_codon:yes stop_codon:yes gene_type:complete
MEYSYNINIFKSLDDLLEKKYNEIEIIYNKKFNNKVIENIDNNIEQLSYDVKKILGKQKSHETKRKQKSKVFQKEQADELVNYIASNK